MTNSNFDYIRLAINRQWLNDRQSSLLTDKGNIVDIDKQLQVNELFYYLSSDGRTTNVREPSQAEQLSSHFDIVVGDSNLIDISDFDNNHTAAIQNQCPPESSSAAVHMESFRAAYAHVKDLPVSDDSLSQIDSWMQQIVIPATDKLVFDAITSHVTANSLITAQGGRSLYNTIAQAQNVFDVRTDNVATRICLLITPSAMTELNNDEFVRKNFKSRQHLENTLCAGIPFHQVSANYFNGGYKVIIIDKSAFLWIKYIKISQSDNHHGKMMTIELRHDTFITPHRGMAMQAIK